MSKQVGIATFYDSLSIGHKLDDFLDGFERREIHLFSYFAAFLFHYNGNPLGEWEYKYIIDESGYPHSKELDDAIERHVSVGTFEYRDNFITITGRGSDEFTKFKNTFSIVSDKRESFIEAACSTALLIPYKETKIALLQDTNIAKAKELNNDNWVDFQYDNLKKITDSLGASIDDLTISAISWIRYILTITNN